MQVQHEAQLIERNQQSDTNPKELLAAALNQTTATALDSYTLIAQAILSPVEHIVCCSQSNLVAVYLNGTNQILLIDTKTYSIRERFPLKACDKRFSKQSFTLKGIDFSPDGTRLAIGQTDCIIYIYRLAHQQQPGAPTSTASSETTTGQASSRTTITGKFVCSSPITCIMWTDYGIIFGTQDGKLKLISIPAKSSNSSELNQTGQGSSSSSQATKVISLYNSPKGSMPISLAFKFPMVVIGFVDCSVQFIGLPADVTIPVDAASNSTLAAVNGSSFQLGGDLSGNRRSSAATTAASIYQQAPASSIEHSCPPYFLTTFANTICCAGSDGRIALHGLQLDNSGSQQQSPLAFKGGGGAHLAVNWLQNVDLKEEIVAVDYSPINEILAAATTTRLLFIKYDQESSCWQLQNCSIELVNAMALTSVRWTKDGAQIVAGTLSGSLELFRCTWNKHSVGEQLDICHIAKNRVRITDRARNLLATYKTQYDIKRVNLLDNGQSVIIWTSQSLLLARLGQAASSELQWSSRQKFAAKFCFDHPGFVLIYIESARELLLVRLGEDAIVYRTKLDRLSKKLISVRRYPPPAAHSAPNSGGSSSRRTSELSPEKTSPNSGHSRQRSAGSARSRLSSATGNREPAEQSVNPESSPSSPRTSLESVNERLAIAQDSPSGLAGGGSTSPCSLLVVDLKSNTREFSRKHQDQIDWLELSYTGNSLVFWDSQNRLYLTVLGAKSETNVSSLQVAGDKSAQLLLEFCEFAKWLPESDILVGQSLHKISIWFNIGELNNVLVLDSRSYNITNSPPLLDLSFKQNGRTLQDSTDSKQQLVRSATQDCKSANKGEKPYPCVVSAASSHLNLSNGVCVPLDKTKVRFYTEVAAARLDSALEVLEREDPSKNLNGLWSSLGWIAIGRSECEIAIRAFTKLDHKSMVECLEKCLERPDEREWRLAMLRGDWDAFERISDADQIISTYKRLNKWSRALDYLTRTQQFRQRDLIEQEFRQWLVERGRFLEGAKIQAKSGDLAGAIELLLENNKLEDAAQLLVGELKSPIQNARSEYERRLVELANRLKSGLAERELFEKAALIGEKILANREEALELYLAGHAFAPALELARAIAPARVASLEESCGDFLMDQFRHKSAGGQSRRQTCAAIDHYLASTTKIKALSAAIELLDFNRAFDVLRQLQSAGAADESSRAQMKQASRSIAEFMLERGERQKAIEALSVGEHYGQLTSLYVEQGDFKSAFETSLKFKHSNDRSSAKREFLDLARDRAADARSTSQAEQIYLMLEEPDLAIEMQRSAKNYDRMLALVEQHRPDSLESCLLLLARELESAGRYREAEEYLLRASESEWPNVVRMYRLANKWEDAYRVARSNCLSEQDPLLVQLAYFWAKSLLAGAEHADSSPAPAQNLLKRLQVLGPVVDFCCENKNFQLALELVHQDRQPAHDASVGKLERDVIKRYAAFLEQQHKFDRAEELLLQHDQLEEAAKMYADNDLHSDAIRVVESRLKQAEGLPDKRRQQYVDLLQRVLVQCADRLASEVKPATQATSLRRHQLLNGGGKFAEQLTDKLVAAQQMYLRAQRPELAVELYKERGMWQEAIQVAQRFAPQLLESVEQALDSQVVSDLAPIVAAASGSVRGQQQQQQRQARRLSRASSRSGLMTSDNWSLSSHAQRQPAVGGQADPDSRRQSPMSQSPLGQTIDYLRAQAELSMRQGDLRATKLALAKFLDSLVDGSFQNEASLKQVSDWLGQLEQILTNRGAAGRPGAGAAAGATDGPTGPGGRGGRIRVDRLLLPRIVALADRVAERCAWGQLAADQSGELVAWLRLRDILAACCARGAARDSGQAGLLSTDGVESRFGAAPDASGGRRYDENGRDAYSDDDDDAQDDLDEEGSLASDSELQAADEEELDRRLLVAHFVTLHGSLLGQLQANLQSAASGASLGSRAARTRTGGAASVAAASGGLQQMPLGKLGRLKAEQPASADILDLLAKLSLSLLRYTDVLEAKLAFYNAGFWLLANNRRDLARLAWSRLAELFDGLASTGSSSLADELRMAGVPEEQRLVLSGGGGAQSAANSNGNGHAASLLSGGGGQSLSAVSPQQVGEVRSWLLETLIEGGGAGAGLLVPLDERGELESSLEAGRRSRSPGGGARAELPACLVSGYPVLPNADQLILGPPQQAGDTTKDALASGGGNTGKPRQVAPKYQARLSEWRRLVLLSRRFERTGGPHSTRLIGRSQHQYPNRSSGIQQSSLPADQQQQPAGSGAQLQLPQAGAAVPLKDIVDFIVKLSGADAKVSQQIQ